MIRLFLNSCLFGILTYVVYYLWTERNAEFPFNPSDYIISEPQFTPEEEKMALLGWSLFRDTRLSNNQEISCNSCHKVEFSFGDNKAVSQGIRPTKLNTPPIINLALHKWFFWNGRVDSLTLQALQPIENPDEHGIDRLRVAQVLYQNYKPQYKESFGDFPDSLRPYLTNSDIKLEKLPRPEAKKIDLIFLNFGKALEEYQRGIIAADSPFDKFMRRYKEDEPLPFNDGFGPTEWSGFNLFLSKTKCVQCHSGPTFSDQKFHFTGQAKGKVEGRFEGLASLSANPLRCMNRTCDPLPVKNEATKFQVKTPTLRNLPSTAPYFHDGSVATIRDVVYLYNRPNLRAGIDPRIVNLYLTVGEIDNLEAFLKSLASPVRDLTDEKRQKSISREKSENLMEF